MHARPLAVLTIALAALAAAPAAAHGTVRQESPPPTTVTPAPTTTLGPPDGSPVDEIVGGEILATTGMNLVAPTAPPLPAIDARAYLIADADTGDVLAALSPHQLRSPASTIKLLTAVTAGALLDPDEPYLATEADAAVEGSRVGLLPGQSYSADDLMHGLLLASGNDAAHAVAEAAGGQEKAVRMMNDEARRIGAFDTHAVTPHGLDSPGQRSSAYDLALIGRRALDEERIAKLVRTPSYDFPGDNGETYQIQNQNRLLGRYDGAIGMKTGFTTHAGHTFVGAADRDGRTLIVTVLGAEGRAEDGAAALFDWAFADHTIEPIGHLVTPDDVTDMIDAAAAREEMEAGAGGEGDVIGPGTLDVFDSADGGTNDVPPVVWMSLVVAALAGGAGFALRRRRANKPGRYSSRG